MTLNYQAQKKILEPVLKSNTNHYCADCNAASPTCTSTHTQGPPSILEYSFAPTAQEHTGHSDPPSPESSQPPSTSGPNSGSITCLSVIKSWTPIGRATPVATRSTLYLT